MNIKEAEAQSGVARQNIRYYEKLGLLAPARNPENDYRNYSAAEVRTLKLIRTLRMLDMPLEEIRRVLRHELTLADAAAAQAQRLAAQAEKLQAAQDFCTALQQQCTTADKLDVDEILQQMEAPGQTGWFTRWMNDYKAVALSEHEKYFTFVPDLPVDSAAMFSDALYAYAKEQNLRLEITQESMTPHFTLDGIEYTASRFAMPVRGIPVTTVRCTVAHPEDYEDTSLSPARRKWMKLLHYSLPVLGIIALNLLTHPDLLRSWWGILLLVAIGAAAVSSAVYNYLTVYNENGKRGRGK